MDDVVGDLAAQQSELAGLLGDLPDPGWAAPTRCEGWDVADVVLHLAQTDELAVGSATGRFEEAAGALSRGTGGAVAIDDGAAMMVELERGVPNPSAAGPVVDRRLPPPRGARRHGPVHPGHLGGR